MAAQGKSRSEEIAPEVEFLVEHFNDAAAVAATGLLCVGERTKTEKLLDAALSEDVAAGGLIYDLQDRRFELFYTPSALPQAHCSGARSIVARSAADKPAGPCAG